MAYAFACGEAGLHSRFQLGVECNSKSVSTVFEIPGTRAVGRLEELKLVDLDDEKCRNSRFLLENMAYETIGVFIRTAQI